MSSDAFTTFPKQKPLRLPLRLKIVIAVMVLCAVAGIAGLASKTKPTPAATGPQYVGFATLVVDNYVAGHVLDVPMATGLSATIGRLSAVGAGAVPQQLSLTPGSAQPATATVQPLPVSNVAFYSGTDRHAGKGLTVETDTFLLEYSDGSLGALDVVIDGTSGGPQLAALPALVPAPATPSAEPQAGAPVAVSSLYAPLSGNLQYRVTQWAQAYASNNQTQLYQVTGDTSSRSYEGLGGVKLVGQPTVTASTQDGPKQPAELVVTVELTLQSMAQSSVIEQASYDLLITGIGDKYPDVVAWGPAGSGSSLTPYENAS